MRRQPMACGVNMFSRNGPIGSRLRSPSGPRRPRNVLRRGRTATPAAETLEGRALLSFLAPTAYGVGKNPEAVVVGDFNGDGRADVAVANTPDKTVGVLLSNPGGTLGVVHNSTTLSPPTSLAAGDINKDGKPDLIAVGDSPTGSLILNNGNGTFPATASPTATGVQGNALGNNLTAVTVADVNGDRRPDMVSASAGFSSNQLTGLDQGSVDITPGNGDGTLGSPAGFTAVGHNPVAVVAADVNRDGKNDLAVVNQGDNTLSVLLNTTAPDLSVALFKLKGNYGTGTSPSSVAAGDLNGDGIPDFVVGSRDGRITVILNRADGSIQSDRPFNVSHSVAGVTLADFNGDGKLDVATVDDSVNTVSVLLGNGDGTFGAPLTLSAGGSRPSGIASGDLNGDGRPDIVVVNNLSNSVTVLLNAGNPSAAAAPAASQPLLISAPSSGGTQAANTLIPVLTDAVTWLTSDGTTPTPGSPAKRRLPGLFSMHGPD